jgi:hypothetical protein
MVFISLRVVRNCCQVPQNAVVEGPLDAGLPPDAAALLAVPLEVAVPLEAGVLEAGVPLEAALPQADSARARATVINGVTSNVSRPLIRDVRSMS